MQGEGQHQPSLLSSCPFQRLASVPAYNLLLASQPTACCTLWQGVCSQRSFCLPVHAASHNPPGCCPHCAGQLHGNPALRQIWQCRCIMQMPRHQAQMRRQGNSLGVPGEQLGTHFRLHTCMEV